MTIKPRSAKAKGREGENRVRDKLRQTKIDPKAYRNPGSGNGLQKGDIYSPRTGFTIEVKHSKNIGIKAWYQAVREAVGDYTKPLLWWWPHRENFENSIVVMRGCDLIELLKLAYKDKD